MLRRETLAIIAFHAFMLLWLTVRPAFAATFSLECNEGVGDANALQDAVNEASWNGLEDIITLKEGCTYTLTEVNNLQISSDGGLKLTIEGKGATISRSNHQPVLEVFPGAMVVINQLLIKEGKSLNFGGGIINSGTLTLNDSSILSSNAQFIGGAVYNVGTLTLNQSTITNNRSGLIGGAIYNGDTGILTMNESTVSSNRADSSGGGIYNLGVMTLSSSSIVGNAADSVGGGIFNSSTLTLSDTAVRGNSAELVGGGIFNEDMLTIEAGSISDNIARTNGGGIANSGMLTIAGGLLDDNHAAYGGGIYNDNAVTLDNSTVRSNSADLSGGGLYNDGTLNAGSIALRNNTASFGGALHNTGTLTLVNTVAGGNYAHVIGGGILNEGYLTLMNNTISGNASGSRGGGIYNTRSLIVTNTIIANSTSGGDCVADAGVIDASFSLIEDGLECVNGSNSGNRTGDPALEADLRLQAGSPAIDAGSNSLIASAEDHDLAGTPRIAHDVVDMGAYEFTGEAAQTAITPQFSAAQEDTEYVNICEVRTTARVNLRAEPSNSAQILLQVPYAATLRAIAVNPAGYYRVSYLEQTGYISWSWMEQLQPCS